MAKQLSPCAPGCNKAFRPRLETLEDRCLLGIL
jgi:hypothetical protein